MTLWTDERIERLKALQRGGNSARRIASALSAECGETISRNAVIGKLARMGLPGGGARIEVKRTPRPHPGNIARKKAARKRETKRKPGPEWSADTDAAVVRRPTPSNLARMSSPETLAAMETVSVPMLGPVAFADLERGQCRWCIEPALSPAGPDMNCCGGAVIDATAPEGRREATHCPLHYGVSTGHAWQ
jgi:GcrA cell cycle regulator